MWFLTISVLFGFASASQPWRLDGRCGNKYPLSNGNPSGCNPLYPCCSKWAWCGKTRSHCSCTGCIDYRNDLEGRNPTTGRPVTKPTKPSRKTVNPNALSKLMRSAFADMDQPRKGNLVVAWNDAENACKARKECKDAYSNYATDMTHIAHGFIIGKEVLDGMSKVLETMEGFKNVATLLGKVAPFLSAFSSVVSILSLFGNSPEVERLDQIIKIINEGFNRMEYRFERIETQLSKLEDTVRQEHFWTRLRPRLEDIHNLKERVKRFLAVVHAKDRKDDLDKDQYDKVFDAIHAIASTFDGDHGSRPLCDFVTDFTKVDRRRYLKIATDLYNRMVNGALNLVLVGKLLNRTDNKKTEQDMVILIKRIGNKIDSCDADILNNKWKDQWRTDLYQVMGDPPAGKEHSLADAINNFLSRKYYHRDWLVVVYGYMARRMSWKQPGERPNRGQRYWIKPCYVHEKITVNDKNWKKRYNILVSSVSKSTTPNAYSLGYVKTYKTAKEIYNHLGSDVINNCRYPLSGVVAAIGNFEIRAPDNRKAHTVVLKKQMSWGGGDKYKRRFHVFVLG